MGTLSMSLSEELCIYEPKTGNEYKLDLNEQQESKR